MEWWLQKQIYHNNKHSFVTEYFFKKNNFSIRTSHQIINLGNIATPITQISIFILFASTRFLFEVSILLMSDRPVT